jgi:pyruvate formate lyase activating enzyme
VFFKGCPLECQWCSTPSSQRHKPELGYDPERCTGCAECIAACPRDAIRLSDDGLTVLTDRERCQLCFTCVGSCPAHARRQYGHKVTAVDVLKELEKDDIFYFHSGGGITLSGGEPLQQLAFAKEILVGCQKRGLHTAIETSGFIPWSHFEATLPYLDTVLIDIKVMDAETHQRITGQSNQPIIENIRKVDESEVPIELYIRIPLVPGINDDEENLRATADFCKQLKKFKELHLLPYHRLGVETYRFLNRSYELDELPSAELKWVEEKAAWIEKLGIPVKVGG